MTRRLRAATRSSPLARWQTAHVASLLAAAEAECEVEPLFVDTHGDRTQALGTPLHQIGGQGVFVKEVQAAVLRGDADVAVHSAKDLPSSPTEGLVLAGVPQRADVRDLLVGTTFESLPDGARVGTSSVRRVAQLRFARPDIECVSIRGNVGPRGARVGELDAVIVAAAGVDRLGLGEEISERFPMHRLSTDTMLPMVGQGALAVECRADDAATIALLRALSDPATTACLCAERAFLATLGGGCELPVGAYARVVDAELVIDALVAASDGSEVLRVQMIGAVGEPEHLGRDIAGALLDAGARRLLEHR